MEQSPQPTAPAARRVLVIAHRGDSRRAPENTLPAFASAVQAGADMVELDFFHSADGVPVVFHDEELDRTSNAQQVLGRGGMRIDSLPLTELQRLDAGAWFGAKFAGTRIPTLEAALDVIQDGSTAVLERKGGDAATCLELLQRKGLLDRVVVISFDWKFVTDCHRLAPDLRLAALGERPLTPETLDEIQRTGAQLVGWNQKHIRPADIEAVHQRGLELWVFTVNDRRRAAELVQAGVDGIITDVPRDMLMWR